MNTAVRNVLRSLTAPFVERRGPPGALYLTFDDGPHPEVTPKVLDILRESDARATFFVVGAEAEKHPGVLRDVVAAGHSVGWHSYGHGHARRQAASEILADLRLMEAAAGRLGLPLHLYRPPYGELSLTALWWCRQRAIRTVLWSLDTGDSVGLVADEVVARVRDTPARDGEIILLHDDAMITVDALPRLLVELDRTGCRLEKLGP
jgi:peptidoglycan-N-acetylglucosamine deacetylase